MIIGTGLMHLVQRETLLDRVDLLRFEASQELSRVSRAQKGQFFTSKELARFMAAMFSQRPPFLHILDAGAGVGSLSAALVAEACSWEVKPEKIRVTAYEIEPLLVEYLRTTFYYCEQVCQQENIDFEYEIIPYDFIETGVDALSSDSLFASLRKSFNAVIINPPYKKISSKSKARRLLQRVGIETSNMYTAFLWLAMRMLSPDGEMVSITPRSFCNGTYFLPFRKALLTSMSIQRIHVFDTRDRVFKEDNVLQENIILHAIKSQHQGKVIISSSIEPTDEWLAVHEAPFSQVVFPDDTNLFIHIPSGLHRQISQQISRLSATIEDLGLSVSTGKVVDFRVKEFLRDSIEENAVPLIYPHNFVDGYIVWPLYKKHKPKTIKIARDTEKLLVPQGWYVLVRRFSSKEERRRLVAAVYDPTKVSTPSFGIENHLNYFHQNGRGLTPEMAKGLAAFLNSTVVDEYFRQFSGHTQVNAMDLRSLKYPSKLQLAEIGRLIGDTFPSQEEIDKLVLERLGMITAQDDLKVKRKIEEAIEILRALNVPKAQINQRSALTLLALLGMKPDTPWSEASAPLYGITEMMRYFREHFGVNYAPNTRETVRRQTIHQFLQMGLVVLNPDDPSRPVNSPKTRYQVEPSLLKLIRSFGSTMWDENLKRYLETSQELRRLRQKEREMALIPVRLLDGSVVNMTPGGQNILVKKIVEEFCPRFTPGGIVVYLGDAGDKFLVYEQEYFRELGIVIDEHSKIPDVVVYLEDKNWLVLIEAVTSHGPINVKRYNELKNLFRGSKAPLVFVTAFLTRKVMVKYLQEIAWETEVWVADAPTHLIHFNGERFLGPYD